MKAVDVSSLLVYRIRPEASSPSSFSGDFGR